MGNLVSPPVGVELALDTTEVLPAANVAGPHPPTLLHAKGPGETCSGLAARKTSTRGTDGPFCLLNHRSSLHRQLGSTQYLEHSGHRLDRAFYLPAGDATVAPA